MLKTRLAPRRRAGDKGWILEGLPNCQSLARGLWDLGDHCWPHVVIALHPTQGQPPSDASHPNATAAWKSTTPALSLERERARTFSMEASHGVGGAASNGAEADLFLDAYDRAQDPANWRADHSASIPCIHLQTPVDVGSAASGDLESSLPDTAPGATRTGFVECAPRVPAVGDGRGFGRDVAAIVEGTWNSSVAEEGSKRRDRSAVEGDKGLEKDAGAGVGSERVGGVETNAGAGAEDAAEVGEGNRRNGADGRGVGHDRVEGGRERSERIGEYYRRNIWGILDFFHSRKVMCAMVNREHHHGQPGECSSREENGVDCAEEDVDRQGEGSSMEGGVSPIVRQWGGGRRDDADSGARRVEVESEEGEVGDEEGWVRVGAEGAEGHSCAAERGGVDVGAADEEESLDWEAAVAGASMGRRHTRQPREGASAAVGGVGRKGNVGSRGWGGTGEEETRHFSHMAPPDLHREIARIVGLVRWGAAGVCVCVYLIVYDMYHII